MGRSSSAFNRLPTSLVRTTLMWVALTLSATCAVPVSLLAQQSRWSLSGSVGYAILRLNQVDDDNRADVEGWNALGIPLGPLGSLKQSSLLSGRLAYRSNREIGFSLTVHDQSKEVTTDYEGSDAMLSLKRGVSSTDVLLGISYYPSAQPYFLEWYVEVGVGVIMGRANANAHGTQTVKVGSTTTLTPLVDTDGTYKKSRTVATFCLGAEIRILRPFFLHFEGAYRFAPLGTLNGDINRSGQHSTQDSVTEFDYSGFLISGGVGIEF
jgi:hypothetical protein